MMAFKSISEYNSDLYSDTLKSMIYENNTTYKILFFDEKINEISPKNV